MAIVAIKYASAPAPADRTAMTPKVLTTTDGQMYDSPNIVADKAESWRRKATGAVLESVCGAKPGGGAATAVSEEMVKRNSDDRDALPGDRTRLHETSRGHNSPRDV
jgi:hypothetical protein